MSKPFTDHTIIYAVLNEQAGMGVSPTVKSRLRDARFFNKLLKETRKVTWAQVRCVPNRLAKESRMEKARRVVREYDMSFKLDAVRLVVDEGYSVPRAAERLGISPKNL